MSGDTRHVKGLSVIQKALDTLPEKMERNVVRTALMRGMKPIKKDAKARLINSIRVPGTGKLAEFLKINSSSRNGSCKSYLRTLGDHSYVGKWIEFGVAAHFMRPKDKRVMSFNGIFVKAVEHPGFRPRPFMRPAMDSQASTALRDTASSMRNQLAKKYGIDTPEVFVDD